MRSLSSNNIIVRTEVFFFYCGKVWNGKKIHLKMWKILPFEKPPKMLISYLLTESKRKTLMQSIKMANKSHLHMDNFCHFKVCHNIYVSVQPWMIFGTLLQLNEWSLTLKMERCRGKMHLKKKIERPLTVLKKLGVYCIAMHENCYISQVL